MLIEFRFLKMLRSLLVFAVLAALASAAAKIDAQISGKSIQFPESVTLSATDLPLEVTFQLQDAADDAVVLVRVLNQKSLADVSFVAGTTKEKGSYQVTIKDLPYDIKSSSQDFQVSAYFGASGSAAPLEWNLAKLKSVATPTSEFQQEQINGGLAWNSEVFEPQPEIHHTFQPPVKMTNAFFSTLFAGAVVAVPWIVFLGLAKQPLSKLQFDTTKIAFLPSLSMLAVEGAFVGLVALYWLDVVTTVFDMVTYGCVLVAASILSHRWLVNNK